MRNQIEEQNRQISRYQELYSSKQEEVTGLNEGLSERI